MGTYDTIGGTPRNDPALEAPDICEVCNKDVAECECLECEVCGLQGCPDHTPKIKVRVSVPVSFEVDYVIEVFDPKNVDRIQQQLIDGDPARWENDPQFYERLGEGFYDFVRATTKEQIEEVKP